MVCSGLAWQSVVVFTLTANVWLYRLFVLRLYDKPGIKVNFRHSFNAVKVILTWPPTQDDHGPLKVTKAALNSCNYMSVTEKKTGQRNLELISTCTPTLNDEARYFMLGIKGGLTAFIRPLGH